VSYLIKRELDFTDNITAQAPYPYLNIKVRRNGVFVDTALNVQPGTPLEMIIYLDEDSRHVYGLLTSFLKVTDNTTRQQEEVIILNGFVHYINVTYFMETYLNLFFLLIRLSVQLFNRSLHFWKFRNA
jgi:hypothetical protein